MVSPCESALNIEVWLGQNKFFRFKVEGTTLAVTVLRYAQLERAHAVRLDKIIGTMARMNAPLLVPLLIALPLALSSCGVFGASSGCTSGYQRPNISALTADLTAARQRWKTANIQDYSYTFSQSNFFTAGSKFRITVRNGGPASVERIGGDPSSSALITGETVDELFSDTARAINKVATTNCIEIDFTYDSIDGHLTSSGYSNWTQGLEDGFGSWSISDFTRL